jgi:hypothetical protein
MENMNTFTVNILLTPSAAAVAVRPSWRGSLPLQHLSYMQHGDQVEFPDPSTPPELALNFVVRGRFWRLKASETVLDILLGLPEDASFADASPP